APGAVRNVTATFTVPADYAGTDPIVNNARVTTTTAEAVVTNNEAQVRTPLANAADLSLTGAGTLSIAPPTDTFRFTLVVGNGGPSEAIGVVLQAATPQGLTFVSNTGDCTRPFPCTFATLAKGPT